MNRIKLDGLPNALLEQLYCTKVSPQRKMVLTALRKLDGCANIDELLVTIYLQSEVIYERHRLCQILHRMSKDGLIIKERGCVGIYSLPITENEGAK